MITTLDQAVSRMANDDKPVLSRAPSEPISIETALKNAQPKAFDASNVPPLCALDIIMLNGRLETTDKETGKTITLNPNGRFQGQLKDHDLALAGNLNDEAKTFLMDNLIKILIQNESSWDSITAWNYAKGKLSPHLDYKTVTSYADKKFAQLAEQGQIKIINKLSTPLTYGK